jgi:hypothetical protein
MGREERAARPSRFVVAVGLLGAAGGGWWLGLALTVFGGPAGSFSDLAAAAVAAALLLAIGRYVQLADGRAALVAFAAVAAVAAIIGPMFS